MSVYVHCSMFMCHHHYMSCIETSVCVLIDQLWGKSNDEVLEVLLDKAAMDLSSKKLSYLWEDKKLSECLPKWSL